MSRFWRALKGYIFWTYDRGSFHYDVMVTLILIFIFVTPRYINFKDQPADRPPHPAGITVTADGDDLVYRVEASAVDAQSDDQVRAGLLRAIEPISGNVTLVRFDRVRDRSGRVIAYNAIVRR
jgi:hypothetical protein